MVAEYMGFRALSVIGNSFKKRIWSVHFGITLRDMEVRPLSSLPRDKPVMGVDKLST